MNLISIDKLKRVSQITFPLAELFQCFNHSRQNQIRLKKVMFGQTHRDPFWKKSQIQLKYSIPTQWQRLPYGFKIIMYMVKLEMSTVKLTDNQFHETHLFMNRWSHIIKVDSYANMNPTSHHFLFKVIHSTHTSSLRVYNKHGLRKLYCFLATKQLLHYS